MQLLHGNVCPAGRRSSRQSAWRTRTGLSRACLVFVAMATMPGCGKEEKQAERPAPAVSIMMIEPRDVPVSMEFVAQTQSSQQVQIYARVTGFLDKRMYTEGTIVKAG